MSMRLVTFKGSDGNRRPGGQQKDQAVGPLRFLFCGILGILLISSCLSCSKPSSHEPVTLTFLDIEWDTPDQMPGIAQDLKDFTRETGISVKRLPRPDGSLNQLALWQELLQKRTGAPDVVGIDVIWSGILSQYLMDLKPYFAAEPSSQSPVVTASYT